MFINNNNNNLFKVKTPLCVQLTENIHATHPHHIKSLTGYNITKAQGKTIFT